MDPSVVVVGQPADGDEDTDVQVAATWCTNTNTRALTGKTKPP